MSHSSTQRFNASSGIEPMVQSPKVKLYPVSFRVNAKEKAKIKAFAQRHNQSVSQYVRRTALNDTSNELQADRNTTDLSFKMELAAKLLGALGQSGTLANLTTFADAAEAGALPVTEELEAELRHACALVLAIRNDLITALGIKIQE